MDIVILFFISSVLLVYTLVPAFLAKRPLTLEVSVQERQRNALKQEKISNLRAIKDIDFELATGKISEDDHEELKTLYSLRVADILDAEKRLQEERS